MREFKRCKNYWWCFKRVAKEYYEEAIGDLEDKKEQLETLLNYVMDFEHGYTKAFVNGQEVKEFNGRKFCDLKDFIEKNHGKEIVIKAKDLEVEIGIYPIGENGKDGFGFDILDYNYPIEDGNYWEEFGEENYWVDCQPM